MNISKNQAVMAAVGGATLVAAGALGYLAFDAYSEKSETADMLEGAVSTVQRLLRAEISPDAASVGDIKRNTDAVSGWTEAAISTAAAGDRAISTDVNEAAFKQKLVDEARRLSDLPGGVEGKIVKAGFAFGFPDFVTGDKLPEKEKLPALQRQWGDIRLLVETLAECGVAEVVRIAPAASAPAAEPAQKQKERPRDRRRAKREEAAEKPAYTAEKYEVDFRAKPAALVRAVNAFATSSRFIVVDAFAFAREGDMIAAALGEGDKKASDQPSPGRRRRRGAAAEEPAAAESAEETAKKGVANDPSLEAPFLVKMAVSTYDFGSAEKASAVEPAAQAQAEESAKEDEE